MNNLGDPNLELNPSFSTFAKSKSTETQKVKTVWNDLLADDEDDDEDLSALLSQRDAQLRSKQDHKTSHNMQNTTKIQSTSSATSNNQIELENWIF